MKSPKLKIALALALVLALLGGDLMLQLGL